MSLRAWWPWLLVAALIVLLPLLGEGSAALRYERQATLNGQIWRMISAHWVHLSVAHAVLNALALLLLLLIFRGERAEFPKEFGLLAACQLGLSALLLAFSPDVDWYVGLSGALHGFVLVLCVYRRHYRLAWLVAAALAVKVGWELAWGPNTRLEMLIGGPVLPVAHCYGAVTGLLLSAAMLTVRGPRSLRSA